MFVVKILIYEANGGFTSYTKPLANAMCTNQDLEVFLMTSCNNLELKGISPLITVLDCQENYLNDLNHNSFGWVKDRVGKSIKNILMRNNIIKAEKFDFILVEFTIPIIDQFFFKKIKKFSKIIFTVHDVIPPNKSKFWSKKSLNKLYQLSDHLVVHSKENRLSLITNFGIEKEKISVIHHGVSPLIKKLSKYNCKIKLGINNSKKVILFYGGIRRQKGLDNLIKSLKNIDCVLIIAGRLPHGESFEPYDILIKKYNIRTIKMIKYISNEMTDLLFTASDIVALPYKYFFSQSGVFMQSIQYSKPIVASNVSSFASYINKYKIGKVCEPNDIVSLNLAIKELIDDLCNNYDYSGFKFAQIDNSWKSSADKHLKIMHQFSDIGD